MNRFMKSFVILGSVTAIVSPARAGQVTYDLLVKVTHPDGLGRCSPKGQTMPITITVNRSFPMVKTSTGASYTGETSPSSGSPFVSFKAVGVTLPGQSMIESDAFVLRNDKGRYGYFFIATDGSIGYSVQLTTTDANVVMRDKLPLMIRPTDFTTATFSYTGSDADGCSGTIISRVPPHYTGAGS